MRIKLHLKNSYKKTQYIDMINNLCSNRSPFGRRNLALTSVDMRMRNTQLLQLKMRMYI